MARSVENTFVLLSLRMDFDLRFVLLELLSLLSESLESLSESESLSLE